MNPVNEKTLRVLVEAGAIKQIRIIGDGARFHVVADTQGGPMTACTVKGSPKTWTSLDATAKWVRGLGIGQTRLDIGKWQPEQRSLRV